MAIKIADVLLTPQIVNVGQSVTIEVKLSENNWLSIRDTYATWQDVKDSFGSWLDIKEN